jgi:tRNA A-37 threonylcarbamoyl transferase component Bud32
MLESIKPSDIPELQCGVLREPSGTRPILRVIKEIDREAVVKDFSVNGFIFRNLAGRFLVWREKKAYQKLQGIPGIPVLYGTIKGPALIMEKIQGRSLNAVHKSGGIPQGFYSELESLLDAIHSAGLAHCDLKREPNIIMGDDGRPYLVDWSASIFRNEFGFFPLSLIFKRFLRDDLNAVIKLKLKYNPELVTSEEKAGYLERGIFERVIRDIRDRSRRLLKKIV